MKLAGDKSVKVFLFFQRELSLKFHVNCANWKLRQFEWNVRLAPWEKNSAADILKYFSDFSQLLVMIIYAQFAWNVRSRFLGKIRKKFINLSAADLAKRVVKVKMSSAVIYNEQVKG